MGRMRFDLGGDRKRGGFVLSLVLGALLISSFLIVLSGCTTELIETINKMVDFYNRDDKDAPVVIFTTPSHGDLTVALNTKITVTFDEYMDPETINSSTFLVNDGTRDVKGTVSYLDEFRMAVFTPTANLISTYQYQIKLTREIRDKIGNRLEEYAWSFKADAVDSTAPTIVARYPEDLAVDVPLNVNVSVTFSEPLDPLAIHSSSFQLFEGPPPGTELLSGSVSYNDASKTLIFNPDANLKSSTVYTAKLQASVSDLSGVSLGAEETWSFTAGAAIDTDPPGWVAFDPGQNDIDVGVKEEIWIDFDEPMDPDTINNKTFYLQKSSGPVEGVVVYDPKPVAPDRYRASFIPKNTLGYMTQYTAVVSGAVEDVSGNQLGGSKSWSFMTVASATAATAVNVNVVNVEAGPKIGQLTPFVDFTNQAGNFLPGLSKYHFRVSEQINSGGWIDKESKNLSIGTTLQSKSVVMLIDTNEIMFGEKYWEPYLEIITAFIERGLGSYDRVLLIPFAMEDPRYMTYYPDVGLTVDKDLVLNDLYKYIVPQAPGPLTVFLYDAVVMAVDHLLGQGADDMRGYDAIIALTCAEKLFEGVYTFNDAYKYAMDNKIPVYTIVLPPADGIDELATLGKDTAGYYYQVDPRDLFGELETAYFKALDIMNGNLRSLYTVTFETKGASGDTVDVYSAVDYYTMGDPVNYYSGEDTETGYTIP